MRSVMHALAVGQYINTYIMQPQIVSYAYSYYIIVAMHIYEDSMKSARQQLAKVY